MNTSFLNVLFRNLKKKDSAYKYQEDTNNQTAHRFVIFQKK